jgi:hypothetical protein
MMEGTMSKEDVKDCNRETARILTMMNLAELRETYKVKQTEIKGFSQPSVSRIERRKDMKLSTLLEYLSSMDLELEMTVRPKHPTKEIPSKVVLLRA